MGKYYTVTLTEAQYNFLLDEIIHEYVGAFCNPLSENEILFSTEQAIANCKISSSSNKTTKKGKKNVI